MITPVIHDELKRKAWSTVYQSSSSRATLVTNYDWSVELITDFGGSESSWESEYKRGVKLKCWLCLDACNSGIVSYILNNCTSFCTFQASHTSQETFALPRHLTPHKNFFRNSLWDDQEELEFPLYANMKWFVWKWENTIIPLFHDGKIRIKDWNIGLMINLLESLPMFLKFNFNSSRGFHSFVYRECQRRFLRLRIMSLESNYC
jgi:hypothetical protein